jgi:hypothetical protein
MTDEHQIQVLCVCVRWGCDLEDWKDWKRAFEPMTKEDEWTVFDERKESPDATAQQWQKKRGWANMAQQPDWLVK